VGAAASLPRVAVGYPGGLARADAASRPSRLLNMAKNILLFLDGTCDKPSDA
jgi:hypothetical protein